MAPPSDRIVAISLQQVRSSWGGLWPHITMDLRAAILDAQVLAAITLLDRSTVDQAWIDQLRARLHAFSSAPMHQWPTP